MTAGSTVAAAAPHSTYDRRTIYLHWITAVLVLLLWSVAQIIDYFPKGAPKIAVRSVHITLGAVLGIVLLQRIMWRSRSGRRLPIANNGVLGQLARTLHSLLYIFLAAVILLGIANAWARGDSVFSLFQIPKLYPSIPQLKPTIEILHQWLANALMLFAAAHVTAALVHHFVYRDDIMRRMLPGDHSIRSD